MKTDTWLMILVMVGMGSAALFSMWLAGRLLFYAVTAPTLPPLSEERCDNAAESSPKQWRAAKRDSQILTIREDAPGSTTQVGRARQTTGGYIRYVDGSYGAAWRGAASATLLADAEQVNELYRQMTLVLNADKPAGTVLQLRWSNHLTAESGIAAELSANAARAGDERFYAPVQILKADALQELINSAASVGFRAGQLSLWCRVPAKDNAGWLRSGPGNHGNKLTAGTDNPAAGKPRTRCKDPLVRRYLAEETAVAAACEKVFAQVQREFPASLQRFNAPRLWQAIYLGHNEQARDTAALPHTAAGYADVRELLCQENWRFGPDYVLHGHTLVGLVSLSMPPQPQTHNGVFRLLTQNPALRFRYTLIVEYLQQDKKRTLRALDKKIWWADKSPRKSPEGRRAESELRQVREDLAAPHLQMVTARVCVLVYGPSVRSQDELQAATAVLDERCEIILSALKQVPGADALREDNTALRVIYPQLLPGALSEQKTGLEIDEVSPACATFAPLEAAWRGHAKPHTLLTNASGELFGLNLFDRAANVGALGVVLGRSGSGKSVFIGKLASDVLACIPEASVVALDFGETYGPLVQALGGRQFRFVPGEEQTINIWDYEGLGEGSPPDDTQIALVVGDLLHLMGLEEGTTEARYKGAVCEEVARAVFNNVVHMNGAGRERREPTLSDFLSLLENFPYEGTELAHAQEINTLLKRYRGHAWLDAPTSAVFQGASRFDVYELDSLELLLADVKSALAYRVAARIISRSKRGADGRFRPCLQIFDEMHKVVEQYPVILRAILRGARQGRKEDTWTLLATHSYRDIAALHGLTANAGLRIIGKQEGAYDDLIQDSRFSPATATAIGHITNIAGGAHQFVIAWDSGPAMQVEIVSVALSPMEYWTYTSNPVERNARLTVAALLLPGEPLLNAIAWLAHNFPTGIAALGLEEIPAPLLEDLHQRRVAWEARQDAPLLDFTEAMAAETEAVNPAQELAQLAESFAFIQARARELSHNAGLTAPIWVQESNGITP